MSDGTQRGVGSADEAALAVMLEAGHLKDVEAIIRQRYAHSPCPVTSVNLLAISLRRQRRFGEAIGLYRQLVAAVPDEGGIRRNLANALADALRFEEAEAAYRKALQLAPANGDVWADFGRMLARAGSPEAVAAFDSALERGCSSPGAVRWDRALALLSLGRYREGWQDYAARWDLPGLARPWTQGEVWDGQPAPRRRLVLREEQGFGDVIQCLRYLPRVASLVGEVRLALRPELAPLLEPPPAPNIAVVPHATPAAPGELVASIIDLPTLFTASPADIPGRGGYLRARADRLARIAAILDGALPPDRLRVGIIWSGSTGFADNANRRASIERFLQLAELRGVSLVSLQKGPPADELAAARGDSIFDLAPSLHDFADTAAACELLDLVVMTDSAVAHLCGALGRPVWLMLGATRHWPWAGGGESTPWYESVRIIRQASPGAWDASFERVAAGLRELVDRKLLACVR